MTVITNDALLKSTAAPASRGGTVLLRHISWGAYCALLEEIGDDAARLTYDNGYLEIEVPSERHEQLTSLLSDLIVTTLKASKTAFQPMRSTTWKRQDRLKGIEADECYYIRSVDRIRGKSQIDLLVDPPPDLAVETDLSGTAIDKLKIYESLAVQEVWRVLESGEVHFHVRRVDGTYAEALRSEAIPALSSTDVSRFLRLLPPQGNSLHSEAIDQFETWLKSTVSTQA